MIGRTRIHLDDVEQLGTFVELEVVMNQDEPLTAGEAEAHSLMTQLAKMGYNGQTTMHLICPTSDESPIARLMKERVNAFNPHGEGIYLLAFETPDVEAFTQQVESAGGRVTRGAPGTANVWVHPTASNFVLMEIFPARG